MAQYTEKLLITGRPGIGKTTLLKRLALRLADLKPSGFYTEEIRQEGIRKGFILKRLDGSLRGILAHLDIQSPYRVGKYGVDIKGLEKFLLEIETEIFHSRIILIDEIGKMECYSERFRSLVKDLLSSDRVFIATIALKGSGFMEGIKRAEGITVIELNEHNRDSIVSEIEEMIRGFLD